MVLPFNRLNRITSLIAQSLSIVFRAASIITFIAFSGPAGFNNALWVSAAATHGPTPVHRILSGIELYAYHPDPDKHHRNIQFLGGNLCIPIEGTDGDGPSNHKACHAPGTRETDYKQIAKGPCCG